MERLSFLFSFFSLLICLFLLASAFGHLRRLQAPFRRVATCLLALCFLAVSFTSGMVSFGLHNYGQLDREELIAVIRCEQAFQREADFTLVYRPLVRRGESAKTRAFQVEGDEWVFEGAILRWRKWLRFLGAKPIYRTLWIAGRFSKDRQLPTSSHPLKEEGLLHRLLFERIGILPFIETSYQSAVSARADYGVDFHLYATPTGFSIKKFTTRFRDMS